MTDTRRPTVLPFSKNGSRVSTRCIPLRIRGEVTFTKLNRPWPTRTRPLLALSEEAKQLPDRLTIRLTRLDDEQLKIVELIAAAMERGVL